MFGCNEVSFVLADVVNLFAKPRSRLGGGKEVMYRYSHTNADEMTINIGLVSTSCSVIGVSNTVAQPILKVLLATGE
jgi:hypothetical protein